MRSFWAEFIKDCGDITGALIAGYGVGKGDFVAIIVGVAMMAIGNLMKETKKL